MVKCVNTYVNSLVFLKRRLIIFIATMLILRKVYFVHSRLYKLEQSLLTDKELFCL
jgi:hypothetical protein